VLPLNAAFKVCVFKACGNQVDEIMYALEPK
jgi:hypothetical protein